MGYLFLASCLWFGLLFMRRLPLRWYVPEWIAAGITAGLIAGSFLAAVLSLVMPYTVSLPVSMGILLAGGTVLMPAKGLQEGWTASLSVLYGWLALVPLALLVTVLFSTHMLPSGPDGWYTVGPTWGDVALHVTLVSDFASDTALHLASPLYSGKALSYPFLIDFLSSVLYRSGWSMRLSLLVPGVMLALSILQLFFSAGLRIFRSVSVAVLAPFIFLLNGSVAGVFLFLSAWQRSGAGFWMFFRTLNRDYTYDPATGLSVYNVLLSAILPQRSTLFGFSVFFLVLILLYEAYRTVGKERRSLYTAAGILTGMLPLAHIHTFLVITTLMGVLLAMGWKGGRARGSDAAYALVAAVVLAAPQLVWQVATTVGGGFTQLHFGWLMDPGDTIPAFWWRTIGPLLPVLIVAPFLKRLEPFHRLLAGVSLGFFVALNVIQFQPNLYDNSKLLVYCLAVASLFFSWFCVTAVRRWRAAVFLVAPITMLMLVTGVLALMPELNQSYLFVSRQDMAFAAQVSRIIPPHSLVLTADTHNHPITMLSGRPVLMGYRGWLWTYGIDYHSREADIARIYAGDPSGSALAKKYGVSYIAVGPPEIRDWGANLQVLAKTYPSVYSDGRWTLFRVGK